MVSEDKEYLLPHRLGLGFKYRNYICFGVEVEEIEKGVTNKGETIAVIELDSETRHHLQFFGLKYTHYSSTETLIESRINQLTKPIQKNETLDISKQISLLLQEHKYLILCLMEKCVWGYPSEGLFKEEKERLKNKNNEIEQYNRDIDNIIKLLERIYDEDSAYRVYSEFGSEFDLHYGLKSILFRYNVFSETGNGDYEIKNDSIVFSNTFTSESPIFILFLDYMKHCTKGKGSIRRVWESRKRKIAVRKINPHKEFLYKFIQFLNSHTSISSEKESISDANQDQFKVYGRILETTGKYYTTPDKIENDYGDPVERIRSWYSSYKKTHVDSGNTDC